jgi:hypothetical protein
VHGDLRVGARLQFGNMTEMKDFLQKLPVRFSIDFFVIRHAAIEMSDLFVGAHKHKMPFQATMMGTDPSKWAFAKQASFPDPNPGPTTLTLTLTSPSGPSQSRRPRDARTSTASPSRRSRTRRSSSWSTILRASSCAAPSSMPRRSAQRWERSSLGWARTWATRWAKSTPSARSAKAPTHNSCEARVVKAVVLLC